MLSLAADDMNKGSSEFREGFPRGSVEVLKPRMCYVQNNRSSLQFGHIAYSLLRQPSVNISINTVPPKFSNLKIIIIIIISKLLW